MKKILMFGVLLTACLFAAPPVPKKAPQGKVTKFECVNAENYTYELILKRGPDNMSPIFVNVDGEEIVIADPMMFAIFQSIIEDKPSGTYQGEKYYTIGAEPQVSNCSKI